VEAYRDPRATGRDRRPFSGCLADVTPVTRN
jgi:hypothetical protein